MFNLSWKTDVRLPEVQSTNKKELLEKTSKMITVRMKKDLIQKKMQKN